MAWVPRLLSTSLHKPLHTFPSLSPSTRSLSSLCSPSRSLPSFSFSHPRRLTTPFLSLPLLSPSHKPRFFSSSAEYDDDSLTIDPLTGAATPPPVFEAQAPKKKKTKKQKEAEARKEKETPEQQEFNEFKNRVQLARLKGEQGEKEMEAELDKLGANGMSDYNKRICDKAINEIYDVLYPYGFHSVWLYKLTRKWAGDDSVCAYLLKNKGKNWYIFAPRRQINLWQECVEDFIAAPVVGDKVTVTNVLDLLKTYYMDIEERKNYTFLEEMIEPPPEKDFQQLVKTCADNIHDEDNLAFFFSKFVRDYPTAIPMLTPQQIHDLLKQCFDRLVDPLNIKNLQQDIVNNEKLRNMEEVMVLVPQGMEPKKKEENLEEEDIGPDPLLELEQAKAAAAAAASTTDAAAAATTATTDAAAAPATTATTTDAATNTTTPPPPTQSTSTA